MREYELHPEAYTDLDEIAEYVALDSPDAAKRIHGRRNPRLIAAVLRSRE